MNGSMSMLLSSSGESVVLVEDDKGYEGARICSIERFPDSRWYVTSGV